MMSAARMLKLFYFSSIWGFVLSETEGELPSKNSCRKFSLPGDKTSFYEFLSAFFEDNQVNSATSTTWCPNDEDLVTDDINRLKIWMTSQIRNGQQERREISEKFLQKLEEVNKAGEGVKSNLLDLTTIVQKRKEEVSKISAWVSSCEEREGERERTETDDVRRAIKEAMTEMKTELKQTLKEAMTEMKREMKKELNDVKHTLKELKEDVNKILEVENEQVREFRDCSDLLASGESRTGVYTIYPTSGLAARVFCDMETQGGGWTVVVARMKQSEQLNFNRDWEDYKKGFGSPEGEYWLGNDNLHRLTSARNYVIRLEVEDYEGAQIWGEWDTFKVDSENEKYRLKVGDYNDQSIAHNRLLSLNNGQSFSSKDSDNDSWSVDCAKKHKGGFWFGGCSLITPTGVYGLKEWGGGIGVYGWTKNDSSFHFAHSLQLKMRVAK